MTDQRDKSIGYNLTLVIKRCSKNQHVVRVDCPQMQQSLILSTNTEMH